MRFIDEGATINQFLCLKKLLTTTKGPDFVDILTVCLETHGFSWDLCAYLFMYLPMLFMCTEGTPSILGSIKKFAFMLVK